MPVRPVLSHTVNGVVLQIRSKGHDLIWVVTWCSDLDKLLGAISVQRPVSTRIKQYLSKIEFGEQRFVPNFDRHFSRLFSQKGHILWTVFLSVDLDSL